MGLSLAGGVMSYTSSQQTARRAEAQGAIAAKQGDLELQRSAQSVEEAMLELEDAREYQRWKEQYVIPAVQQSLDNPRQSDPAQVRASASLARGLQVDQSRDALDQGIVASGFDIGGTRHQAALSDLSSGSATSGLASLGAAHEAVKQQGISNAGAAVSTGRKLYKQQGIV
jgi:hypothetical protein